MSWSVFLPQLAVMAIVTYLIRMLPLALFLAGYLAAYSLGAWAAAVGAAGFALGLVPAFVRDRRLKKRPPDHIITGFVK